MAVQYLDFPENPLILHKFKKKPPKNTNLKSFWAFLLSIFIYISVFYIFNISPSTVLSTTKFWFFISNTIILIIAADFGSFSASKDHEFYDDYVKNTRSVNFSSLKARKIPDEINDHNEIVLDQNLPEEKIIEMAVKNNESDHKEEDKQIITVIPKIEKQSEEFIKEKEEIDIGSEEKEKMKKKNKKGKRVRFNSEKIIIVEEEELEEKPVLQRSLSDMAEGRVEENEFSAMSNEELNRRVEDFIRRFNRQIRDQAVRHRNSHF